MLQEGEFTEPRSVRAATVRESVAPRHPALLVIAALLFSAAAAFAIDISSLKPEGYVNDFAGVLDPAAKTAIERYCGDVERATGAQMAVVTIDSIGDDPIEDVANKLYRQWGIGKKGKDEGVLLLLAVKDKKNRIEVGYGLEPVLPDGFVGSVLREMRPSLQEGNYAAALQAGATEIGQHIAESKGVAIERTMPRRAPPARPDVSIPGPLIILGLIFLFMLIGRGGGGGGFLTGLLLGNLFGGSRYRGGGGSGWGGGGFGGG